MLFFLYKWKCFTLLYDTHHFFISSIGICELRGYCPPPHLLSYARTHYPEIWKGCWISFDLKFHSSAFLFSSLPNYNLYAEINASCVIWLRHRKENCVAYKRNLLFFSCKLNPFSLQWQTKMLIQFQLRVIRHKFILILSTLIKINTQLLYNEIWIINIYKIIIEMKHDRFLWKFY